MTSGGQGERSPQRAFLSLGSNMGDRRAHLAGAVAALPDVVAVSDLYETDPVGGPEQGPFLNCVVELRTTRSPTELLDAARAAEAAAGRVRTLRWGPRTLDVDVLLIGDMTSDDPELTIPHPRMWERAFVLVPLADLAPELARPHLESLARRQGDSPGTPPGAAAGAATAGAPPPGGTFTVGGVRTAGRLTG